MEEDLLNSLAGYFRSRGHPVSIAEGYLLIKFSHGGESYHIAVEPDFSTGLVRVGIVSNVEVPPERAWFLLEKNFYLWGSKIGVDPEGFLFVSTEIPLDHVKSKSPSTLYDAIGLLINAYIDTTKIL